MNERAIFALAAALVLFSFLAPNNFSAFAVAPSCAGSPVLHLTPNPAQAGQLIAAKVTGLKNCFGAEILLKDETSGSRCSGNTIVSYQCRGVGCDNSISFTLNTAKEYVIAACIDRDNDNYYLSQNEHSQEILKVTSLPDLAIGGVVFSPKAAYAGNQIIATVALVNNGVASARGFTTNYELFREGQARPFYTYNTANDDTSGVYYFRQHDLQPGGSAQLKIPAVSLAAGSYKIKVTLDAEKRYEESDEGNNVYETTLTVY